MLMIYTHYTNAIIRQGANVGKVIGQSRYLHFSALCQELQLLVHHVCLHFTIDITKINVIRIERNAQNISLLEYDDFIEPFPRLHRSHTIEVKTSKIIQRTYGKNGNHPILHRKELLLLRTHPNYNQFAALTEQAESYNLFTNLNKIGYQKYWSSLIESKGLQIIGHQFVPKE